jgi:hypothetical protein
VPRARACPGAHERCAAGTGDSGELHRHGSRPHRSESHRDQRRPRASSRSGKLQGHRAGSSGTTCAMPFRMSAPARASPTRSRTGGREAARRDRTRHREPAGAHPRRRTDRQPRLGTRSRDGGPSAPPGQERGHDRGDRQHDDRLCDVADRVLWLEDGVVDVAPVTRPGPRLRHGDRPCPGAREPRAGRRAPPLLLTRGAVTSTSPKIPIWGMLTLASRRRIHERNTDLHGSRLRGRRLTTSTPPKPVRREPLRVREPAGRS